MLIKSYIYVFLFLQESYNPLKKISGLSIESSRQIMKRLGGCFLTANQIRFADLPKNSLLLPGQQHQHPTVSWKWTLFLAQEWRFLTSLKQWLLQFTVPYLLCEYGGLENCNVYHLSDTWVIWDTCGEDLMLSDRVEMYVRDEAVMRHTDKIRHPSLSRFWSVCLR